MSSSLPGRSVGSSKCLKRGLDATTLESFSITLCLRERAPRGDARGFRVSSEIHALLRAGHASRALARSPTLCSGRPCRRSAVLERATVPAPLELPDPRRCRSVLLGPGPTNLVATCSSWADRRRPLRSRTRDSGRDPGTGKRRQLFHSAHTKRDAETLLIQLLHERDDGLERPTGRQTVGQYLERWLDDYVALSVAPSTASHYREIVRKRVIPAPGRPSARRRGAAGS